jgi:hypothetical protein
MRAFVIQISLINRIAFCIEIKWFRQHVVTVFASSRLDSIVTAFKLNDCLDL